MSRALLPLLLCTTLACGGAPFVAGELAAPIEAGTVDGGVESSDDGGGGTLGDEPEASAPARDSGTVSDPDGGRPIVDGGATPDSDAGTAPPIDAGVDSGTPPSDSGAGDAGPIDPVTYACGSKTADGAAPVPSSLQWWASVSVLQPDGGAAEDYCNVMSLGPGSATFPYTCEGIASVWSCTTWQGEGSTLGCHPNSLNPGILQVDCEIP